MPITNPSQLVDEFKRSGEFDRLRRDLLRRFQQSDALGPFNARVDEIARNRLESDPMRSKTQEEIYKELMDEIERYPLVERAADENRTLTDPAFAQGIHSSLQRLLGKDRGQDTTHGPAIATPTDELQNGNAGPERKHDPHITGTVDIHISSETSRNEPEGFTVSRPPNEADMLIPSTTDARADKDIPELPIHRPSPTANNIVDGSKADHPSSLTLSPPLTHFPESASLNTFAATPTNGSLLNHAAFDTQLTVSQDTDVNMKVDEDSAAKINGNAESNGTSSLAVRPREDVPGKPESEADFGIRTLNTNRTADVPTVPVIAPETPILLAITQDLSTPVQHASISMMPDKELGVPTTDISGSMSLSPAVHMTPYSSPSNENITNSS